MSDSKSKHSGSKMINEEKGGRLVFTFLQILTCHIVINAAVLNSEGHTLST